MPNQATKLISHSRPHLDDLAAMWLLKSFHPDFTDLPTEFWERPADGKYVIPEDAVAVGIGLGQFDEHKGDLEDCAATLVWKWLLTQPEVQIEPQRKQALERLLDWVLKEDRGQLNSVPWREWSLPVPVENYWLVVQGDNAKVYAFAANLLDAVLIYLEGIAALDADWEKRVELKTEWGKAVAIKTSAGGVSERVYDNGAILVIQIDPTTGARQFRAQAGKGVDLSRVYDEVRSREPEASWFLHHSKGLLLCGSRSAPQFVPSKLTLREMIELVKK